MKGEFHKACDREFRRRHRQLEPEVRAALAKTPLMDFALAMGVTASQNVLKDCMAITFNHAMPQGREFFVEMATRLACYCVTALPADDQEMAMMLVRDSLMNKLADMQANGHVIASEWT